jgi:hypothetical protein
MEKYCNLKNTAKSEAMNQSRRLVMQTNKTKQNKTKQNKTKQNKTRKPRRSGVIQMHNWW